jgi:RNA polymerase sigma-70 factor (ECF subfamily)
MDRLTELALAARDGNAYAVEEFVRRSQPQVRQLCRHLGDPETVDDLVQEVYYRALRALPRFRNDGPAIGWLLTIARRTCADETRRRIRLRRRTGHLAVTEEKSYDNPWTDVADLVAELEHDRREAFVLTQFVGLSYADAAAVLGCPVGTVRSRVSRARSDLIELTAGDDDARGMAQ